MPNENKPLMKCGHVANATDSKGNPCCAICAGINPGACEAVEGVDENELLKGRKAKCDCCGKAVDSSFGLPFFEHRPDREYDRYYCGCRGWD